MCGIAGIFNLRTKQDVNTAVLEKMNQSQHHRGPDETGMHFEPGLGFAHKRLSIIDLSSGQQPLFNEDGSVVVVFNGEIYNFPELMQELKAMGHVFRTHCDTEVIVHAWESWGEACLQRFRGMFAFALWDRQQQTLFLARDRLGVKPFYYALLEDESLIFGSELKVLMAHPGLKCEIDPFAVEEYFAYGYVPDPRTIYQQARKLPPAHFLKIHFGEALPAPQAYWDLSFEAPQAISEAQAQEQLLALLRESIQIRLVAEVPLGAFLSGGVDSSAVVALMAEASADPVRTCSISFGDPAFNESAYAAEIAQRYQTIHQVEQVESDDFDLIDVLSALYDEPYADSSALPTYRLCELAKRSVTVALSGDGGDEGFAGYRRYRWHMNEERVRDWMPNPLRQPLFGLLGKIYPKADWAPKVFRAKATLQGIARDSVDAYFHSVSQMSDVMREQLFNEDFKQQLAGYRAIEVMRQHDAKSNAYDGLSRIQYLDVKTYLPGDILTKVDRASMAHALEVREPLLDHRLLEWAARLPASLRLQQGEGKYIFKKSMESYLPHDILYRKKMGFAVPLASWFRGPLKQRVEDVLLGGRLPQCGYFKAEFLAELYQQHQAGLKDYSTAIWSLLMFEAFLRRHEQIQNTHL